jgi:hypothetical protein
MFENLAQMSQSVSARLHAQLGSSGTLRARQWRLHRRPESTSTRIPNAANLHAREWISTARRQLSRHRSSRGRGRACRRRGRLARPASSRSSRPTPTATARCGPSARALEAPARRCWPVADIEEGVDLRRAGVRAPILVFGALSVSDLDGRVRLRLTPTISSPAAPRALQAAARARRALAYHLKIDTGMQPPGFPPRQPAAHAPGAAREPAPRLEAVLHALRDGRRAESPLFESSARALRGGACACSNDLGGGAAAAPRRQQRGAAARLARLVRLRAAGAAAVRLVPPPLAHDAPLRPVMSLRAASWP